MSQERDMPQAEWSHFVDADDITGAPSTLVISADDEQRKNLAKRLDILSVDRAKADLKLVRIRGNMVVHITGEIEADVTQECVVTGDPVQGTILEQFEAWYADPESAISFTKARKEKEMKKGAGEMPIVDESEDPEPIIEGRIDVGDLATQYLSLGLNPYPHAPGVEEFHAQAGDVKAIETGVENPFAGLKEWKDKLTKNKD